MNSLQNSFAAKSTGSFSVNDPLTFGHIYALTRIVDRIMAPKNAEKYVGFILLKLITLANQQRLGLMCAKDAELYLAFRLASIVEFLCAHNTQTMFIGHMSTHETKVTVDICKTLVSYSSQHV